MKIINDSVFGKMEYDHCWQKKDNINIFGKEYNIYIIANAYTDQSISNAQRKSYKWFCKSSNWNNGAIENILKEYLKNYFNFSQDNCDKIFKENIDDMFTITSVLIQQNGDVLLLFEFALDKEVGLAVQIYPKLSVGSQDLFL